MDIREIIRKVLNEKSTTVTSGQYNGPISIRLKKWKKSELGPFTEFADNLFYVIFLFC